MWTNVKGGLNLNVTHNLNDCYLLRWHMSSGVRRPFHKPVAHLPQLHLGAVSDSLSIRTATGCCGPPLWHMSFWRCHFIICHVMWLTAIESTSTTGWRSLCEMFQTFLFFLIPCWNVTMTNMISLYCKHNTVVVIFWFRMLVKCRYKRWSPISPIGKFLLCFGSIPPYY